MNERIRELALETDIWVDKHFPDNEFYHIRWEERYAEVMIKEFIQILQRRYMGDNNREDMEVRRCIEDVKKHFGIEN